MEKTDNLLMTLLKQLNEMWHCFAAVAPTDGPMTEDFIKAKDRCHEILSQLSEDHDQVRKLALQVLQEVQALKEFEAQRRSGESIRYANKYVN